MFKLFFFSGIMAFMLFIAFKLLQVGSTILEVATPICNL